MDNTKAKQFRLILSMKREIDPHLVKLPAHVKPCLDSDLHGADLAEVYCGLIAHYSSLGFYVQRDGTYALNFTK